MGNLVKLVICTIFLFWVAEACVGCLSLHLRNALVSIGFLCLRTFGIEDSWRCFISYSQGRNGRAFLFSHAMNVMVGPKEDRQLTTGLHMVADVYCCDCHEVLGWKYERAYGETQKYKEGKYILEKSKIVREDYRL